MAVKLGFRQLPHFRGRPVEAEVPGGIWARRRLVGGWRRRRRRRVWAQNRTRQRLHRRGGPRADSWRRCRVWAVVVPGGIYIGEAQQGLIA
eukprot:g44702.t1